MGTKNRIYKNKKKRGDENFVSPIVMLLSPLVLHHAEGPYRSFRSLR